VRERRVTLAPRQRDALLQVVLHVNAYGCPPNWRELAAAMGNTTTAAAGHLRALERKGFIERDLAGRACAYRLTRRAVAYLDAKGQPRPRYPRLPFFAPP
jgi:SOS-response transcriptional repressor LexA